MTTPRSAHRAGSDAPDADVVPAPRRLQAVWSEPVRSVSGPAVAGMVAVAILALLFLGVILVLAAGLGRSVLLPAAFAALVPLIGVLLAVRWIDRWEPEPRLALAFAFLWGAAAAVVITLAVDAGLAVAGLSGRGTTWQTVVETPLIEESAKAVGVLAIFLVGRRYFDGPLDGLVYAAVVGSGFAFTENVLYFGEAIAGGGAGALGATFVVRAILSPFAHVMFCAAFGVALGLAVRRGSPALGWGITGWVAAVALHAGWNGALQALGTLPQFALYYTLVQIPLFAAAVVVTVQLRREEIRVTRLRLGEYQAAGWFSPGEVRMLSTWTGRRQATAWAATLPGDKRRLMREFTRDATRLALSRQRRVVGRGDLVAERSEHELLASLVHCRTLILGP